MAFYDATADGKRTCLRSSKYIKGEMFEGTPAASINFSPPSVSVVNVGSLVYLKMTLF